MITKDYQFELLPSAISSTGFAFGIGLDVSMDDGGFSAGSADWASQDSEDPTSGVTMFGRDRLLGPTWNFQLHVNRETPEEALATLGIARAAWYALHIRDSPGAVIPLRYRVGGRTRRVYGRPRRFEAPPDNRILGGYVPISSDFKCVDGFHYDDVETAVTLQLGSLMADPDQVDSGGGFVFPVTFPTTSLAPTTQQDQFRVLGDAPAYPVVRFNGPVTNPKLVTDEWTLSLEHQIPTGSYVEIDTRPWRQTVLLNGTASLAGKLGRRQRLSRVAFEPGRFEAMYTGSTTANSTCEVRWANTWTSL